MSAQFAFLFSGRTKDSILYVVTAQAWRYKPGFVTWLSRNFHVWERFEAEANRVYDAGRRHYSARTIGEYLRHETATTAAGDEPYKISDWWWPQLARLYTAVYIGREEFFEIRERANCAEVA